MPVPSNIKTPNVYTHVNISTQRTGLPANNHKVLFLTNDLTEISQPVDIYDKAKADEIFGTDSVMGRMITAAIKTHRAVNVEGVSVGNQ